ncbi:ABC transporter ATP-binding protein [Streptomyces albiaxialis]|uniref:ABC transporter ATP-binding protein n=1 Tax=Streptomyces albiaxialis TaxID=329523 RepID=UPI0031D3138B
MTVVPEQKPRKPEGDEDLRFVDPTGSRERAGRSIRTVDMARRLPALVRRSLGLAWRVDKRAAVGLLVCQAASGAIQALGLFAVSGTIGAVLGEGDTYDRLLAAWPSLATIGAAAAARAVLGIVVNWLSSRLGPFMSREAELMLLESATATELAAYDSPGFNERREAADRGAQTAQDLVTQGQDLIAASASLIASAGVLAVLHPLLLPLLMAASLPQALAQISAARVHYLSQLEMSGNARLLSILRWHVSDRYAADQIRTGTMRPFLLAKYRSITERINRVERRAVDKGARMALVGAVCGGMAATGVWAALVVLSANGRLSLAHAGAAVFALQTVGQSLRGLVTGGARIMRTGLYWDDWQDFLQRAGGFRSTLRRGTLTPAPPRTIELRDVSYRYEEADADAVHGVTLTLRRGEVLALVGYNGSGKTTLGKLLTGLYLPTGGSLCWDGVATGEMDPDALWAQVAMVPQDYARWPLTARENITLGQPRGGRPRGGSEGAGGLPPGEGEAGDAAVREACAASGADDVLAKLRSGLDTLLARDWLGGQELSGGQWQRIALARAFHREAGLLVLDEPTAALDPLGEYRIFAGLRQLAATRAVVLITHRLTNVATADRILVLDQGRVVQQGTFDELVDEPGLFRDLWAYQHERGTAGEARG